MINHGYFTTEKDPLHILEGVPNTICTNTTPSQQLPHTERFIVDTNVSLRRFFQWAYVAHCPLPGCTCRNVSVLLQNSNFSSYTGHHQLFRKLLWQQGMCVTIKGLLSDLRAEHIVRWYYTNRQQVACLLNVEEYKELNTSMVCICGKKIIILIMVGASHMRYKFDIIVSL